MGTTDSSMFRSFKNNLKDEKSFSNYGTLKLLPKSFLEEAFFPMLAEYLTFKDLARLSSCCKLLRSREHSPIPLVLGISLPSIHFAGEYHDPERLLQDIGVLPFNVEKFYVLVDEFHDQG